MTESSDVLDTDMPDPPDLCEECDCREFISRSRPPTRKAGTDADYIFAFHECADCGERYNERTSYYLSHSEERAPDWREVFGHPEPYKHQKEAIPELIDIGVGGNYMLMEGGTGTGKTMISLTAGLQLVKDPRTKYERVMVLTSVKQQLRQFENDLRVINENLPDDIPGIRSMTLVGKSDMCPYTDDDVGTIDPSDINYRCRTLRDKTSKLMSKNGTTGVDLAESATVPAVGDDGESELEEGEWPYHKDIPRESDVEFCPFYAQYKGHGDPLFTFGHADDLVLSRDETVKQSVEKGVCPHSAMSVLARDADVIIGNYYHAFDDNTLNITHPLIDDTTFLIADEAHMIEPRVRSVLSEEVPFYRLGQAADEVGSVYNAINGSSIDDDYLNVKPVSMEAVEENVLSGGIKPDMLYDVYRTLRDLDQYFNSMIGSRIDGKYPDWQREIDELPQTIELPLRDPTRDEPDAVTEWAEERGVPEKLWELLDQIGESISDALTQSDADGNSSWAIDDVAPLMNRWFTNNHIDYFREVILTKNSGTVHRSRTGWRRAFSAQVSMYSVMPRTRIGGRVTDFGGGVLMSATLAPMDVYREVLGLDYFSAMEGEKFVGRTYVSNFPEENRESISLDLPKYTYENRGDVSELTETRKKYANAIVAVAATTPGNVLVSMPSYTEAMWASKTLKNTDMVDKPVLLDESSAEKVTKQLKQRFFDGEPKVLVTSLRGTLTEGVDYDGDKLRSCIVCGVPIDNVGSPRTKAMQSAYENQFGGAGFAYGLTVPAVRKARQAFGRVIRGDEDVGVRVLADTRYTSEGAVRGFLSDTDQDEFEDMSSVNAFYEELQSFWEQKDVDDTSD